ncbi:hypothetical protein K491DRAFT_110846 [Lophiostoma macrostomum CBS 122681]|uniref:Uncharacterized protein n=1 Tax=Lophiostoma macrostomum CBS 122681 TaxID=1314788 RepID=A0A6A6STX2_9PLEO|nr:hypothetical protein K491DRAFT_110846 [Lophiostoma macrostomum CBS 122681]
MVSHKATLTLGAFAALAQSKAIITNLCDHAVYLWSVPNTKDYAENFSLKPGNKFIEAFHYGSPINPGIALKLSTHNKGIFNGYDEIDLAYTIDRYDHTKLWISLDKVRGNALGGNLVFFTCSGAYKTPYVPTRQCSITDDIELVLCGSERTGPAHDDTPSQSIIACAGSALEKRATNGTMLPRPRACQGRVLEPKRVVADKEKKGDNPGAERYPKRVESTVAEPRQGTFVNKDGCECSWDQLGLHCDCDNQSKNATKGDKEKQHRQKSDNKKKDCLKTGDFEYCFDKGIAQKINLDDVDSFKTKYEKPLLGMLYSEACNIAAYRNWDCDEFKSAMKKVYPNIEEDKASSGLEPRNTTDLFKAEQRGGVKQSEKDFSPDENCRLLIVLLATDEDKKGRTSEDVCKNIIRRMKVGYHGQKIYLGALLKKHGLDKKVNDDEITRLFQKAWPEFAWDSSSESSEEED